MTGAPAVGRPDRRVVVIGTPDEQTRRAEAELRAAGVTNFTVLTETPTAASFDERTDAWTLRTAGGQDVSAEVIVLAQPPLRPWTPTLLGHNEFRGPSFHAARWDADFDPSGKHVAVIGGDSTAGTHIPALLESAASVTVFAHAPRRLVAEVPFPTTRARRWLRRRCWPSPRTRGPAAKLVGPAIEAITESGVRTRDGVHHRAEALVYGTGFTVPETGGAWERLREVWVDGMEPYLGVAVHGVPNCFLITGPDVGAQAGIIAACLALLDRTASRRIEVRRNSHRVFNERVYTGPLSGPGGAGSLLAPLSAAFDLSSDAPRERDVYDGEATLTIAGAGYPVRVRLTGSLSPIDGLFHWQGTVLDRLPDEAVERAARQPKSATLTVGARNTPTRIVERTPWGTHSVAGVGAPPYEPAERAEYH